MRKFFFTLFLVTLLFYPNTSLAKQVFIGELYLKITLPDDYTYITRDTTDINSIRRCGFKSRQEVLDIMQSEEIYLIAYNNDSSLLTYLLGAKEEISQMLFDFRNFDSLLDKKEFKDALIKGPIANITVETMSKYRTKSALYFLFDGQKLIQNQKMPMRGYITVRNGLLISIIFQDATSANRFIGKSDECTKIIDSIEFTRDLPLPTESINLAKRLNSEDSTNSYDKFNSANKTSSTNSSTSSTDREKPKESDSLLASVEKALLAAFVVIIIGGGVIYIAKRLGDADDKGAKEKAQVKEPNELEDLNKAQEVKEVKATTEITKPEEIMPIAADSITNAKEPSNNLSDDELLETLEKLGELHQRGIITEEEFNEKKTKILDKI